MAHQVHVEIGGQLEHQEQMETRETMEVRERPDYQVLWGLMVIVGILAREEKKVILALWDLKERKVQEAQKEPEDCLDIWENKVILVLKEDKVQQGLMDQLEFQGQWDHLELKDQLETQDQKVTVEKMDGKVHLDLLGHRVSLDLQCFHRGWEVDWQKEKRKDQMRRQVLKNQDQTQKNLHQISILFSKYINITQATRRKQILPIKILIILKKNLLTK